MRSEKEIIQKLKQIQNREKLTYESGNDIQLADVHGIRKALEWVLSFDEGGKR